MQRYSRLHPVLLGLAGLAGAGSSLFAQDMSRLRFMAGCWEGTRPDGTVIEEIWTAPSDNLMLGLTRYLAKKEATAWEFTSVERAEGTVLFVAQTRREAPDTFRVSMLVNEAARFERQSTDFPTVIFYRLTSDGSLIARLEGPPGYTPPSLELRFRRVKCPGA